MNAHKEQCQAKRCSIPQTCNAWQVQLGYTCLVHFGSQHSVNVNTKCIFVIDTHVVHRLCNIQHDLVN